MKTSDFNFDLPEELIAQTPIEPRDHSRLMVLDKATGAIEHRHFYDIIDYLTPADCLVLNDSRVLPARIYGVKEGTGAHVEFLLLQNKGGDVWEALAGPGKRAKKGSRFSFGDGLLHCEVVDVLPDGNRLIHFEYEGVFFHLLDQIGQMPLPPYIKAPPGGQGALPDRVLPGGGLRSGPHGGAALHPGAAGDASKPKGVELGFVTLHVGLGTFRPVSVEDIQDHKMHSEHYYMPQATADLINKTKARGGRVIAVGTTSCRTIESVAQREGRFQESAGWTDIFLYPGCTLPGGGRPHHQFPPAGEHADYAGFRLGRPGERPARLQRGRPGALPLLQLWRRHVHPLNFLV